ncbi:MAG: hypothetical protein MKZ98_04895 [Pseudomonadales bacterium]|nr:hypothetical protein [Pseudomonadales bacterium]MEE2914687.1 hypothetical protein [Pseudomonadota bacterium]
MLCTEPFEVTAKNIARVMGMPDYPFVILDHPLGSCTIEEIRERAKIAADAAVEILTT